jgi:hypothetical protein
MLISEAFRAYGAKLNNIQWSISAFNEEGELVVSLWKHYFNPAVQRTITYVDKASRWSGNGNTEFRKYLPIAYDEGLIVRAVIARTKNPAVIDRGGSGANLGNTFSIKKDWIGKVTVWDGDNFEIEFKLSK